MRAPPSRWHVVVSQIPTFPATCSAVNGASPVTMMTLCSDSCCSQATAAAHIVTDVATHTTARQGTNTNTHEQTAPCEYTACTCHTHTARNRHSGTTTSNRSPAALARRQRCLIASCTRRRRSQRSAGRSPPTPSPGEPCSTPRRRPHACSPEPERACRSQQAAGTSLQRSKQYAMKMKTSREHGREA